MKAGQTGVTLIEILVGLTIFSLAAGIVVLTAPPRRPPARDAAETFAARLAVAFDEAVFTGRERRLEWTDEGYSFAVRDGDRWRSEADWRPRATGVTFSIRSEGEAASNALALNGGNAVGALVGFGAPLSDFAENADLAGRSAGDEEEDDGDREIFPLDPLGVGSALIARFESREGAWIAELTSEYEIRVRKE
ncbi:MAG: type II secretion system protein GspH [Alphaproteobacteria bacterium]|nr:type II secretion system protein GspH [Alphaproteobacteria bacterium]